MSAIYYYLSLPILYGLSLLPFPVLYVLSDIMYFLLYKLIGYRTGVVERNLRNAFSEKNDQEIRQIQDRFYRYFCDLVLETLKTLTINEKTLQKRLTFEDLSVFEKYYEQRRSVIIVMGHWGNWELAGARFSLEPIHQLFVIYHPLANPHFNQLVYHMRTRLGNKLYAMKETFRGMVSNRKDITATAFIADQTPPPKGAYWTTFLNQDTPVFTGTAKIAKKLNYPIIYVGVERIRRGYYHIKTELLADQPADYAEDELSEMHTRRLEQDIIKQPEYWLWTHRRWKHKKPDNSRNFDS